VKINRRDNENGDDHLNATLSLLNGNESIDLLPPCRQYDQHTLQRFVALKMLNSIKATKGKDTLEIQDDDD
jgi:hypothetical protein